MKYFRDEFDSFLDLNKDENDTLIKLRKKSFENFMETGLPTSKWEDWQFTNFSSLNAGDFRLSSANDVIKPPGIVPGQIPHSHLLLIINGHYQPGLSKLPKNVTISSGADHYFSHPEYYLHSKYFLGLAHKMN